MERTGLPVWQARMNTLVSTLIAATAGAVACYFVSGGPEAGVPQYQRRAASEAACDASAIEISRLRLQPRITFMDDCRQPKVTPAADKPGHLIVARLVETQTGHGTARKTYFALMDGRGAGAWRMVEVASAANDLPPSLAWSHEPADRTSPDSPHSH